MSAYARWTGDVEGVEVIANGDKFDYIGKCFDDKWWVSPACRGDPRTCIPVITAGTGWKAQALMHWSTVYGMPTAIGVAQTWGDYVSLVNNHETRPAYAVSVPLLPCLGPPKKQKNTDPSGCVCRILTPKVILFYWWVPDATFVLQQPHAITFPLHVAQDILLREKGCDGSWF
ncbi:unnamed protein product [Symbiodinium natans]|uniref:Uncharacterized protein n=1 Tax=Symbiodinium natans TaxID=878477 RepID=A0A812U5W9_9DINO|nr:unnamed protein product [Symbiodinium natans]